MVGNTAPDVADTNLREQIEQLRDLAHPNIIMCRVVLLHLQLTSHSMMACVTKSRMEPTMLVLEEMEQGNMRDFLRRVCCICLCALSI